MYNCKWKNIILQNYTKHYSELVKNCFTVCLKTLNVSMFLIMSGKSFQIIAPEYCKEHLKELLLALGKNNLFVQHDLVIRVAISRNRVNRSVI